MRIFSRKTLIDFWNSHPDSQKPLENWYRDAEKAQWKTPQDIKKDYSSASFLKNNRVVFNIGGNKYRLIIVCVYEFGRIFIRFVGTHSEYDAINGETI